MKPLFFAALMLPALLLVEPPQQQALGQDSSVNDGPVLRSSTSFVAAAQIVDFTSSYGGWGTIQIRRGSAFFSSRPIESNRNQILGVRTAVPGRRYEITVWYRGRVASTFVTATNPRSVVTFYFTADGQLRTRR